MNNKIVIALIGCLLASLTYIFLPDSCPEPGKRTAAVLVVSALFWVSELFPLYVTSLLSILLLTFLLTIPGTASDGASYTFFLAPFADPVIILFFGGFVLAAMWRKYHLDIFIAEKTLYNFAKNPHQLLIATIVTTGLIGLWISNTATTVIMLAIIQPFIRDDNKNEHLKKSLVLSVPFAASIAGSGTPIASPPNAIAMGLLHQQGIELTFLQWMAICIPLVIIRLAIAKFSLSYFFPVRGSPFAMPAIPSVSLRQEGKWVGLISMITILLFITSSWTGLHEAIIALMAAAAFGLAGFCEREDIKRLDWDILILMWGGLALGIAIDKSGFGKWFVSLPIFEYQGWLLVTVFALLTFIFSCLISNTATAALFLPLALSIEGENKVILAITITLTSSLGLMFPIGSPPNALAYSSGAISAKDMFKAGLTIDLVSLVIILSGFRLVIPFIIK